MSEDSGRQCLLRWGFGLDVLLLAQSVAVSVLDLRVGRNYDLSGI